MNTNKIRTKAVCGPAGINCPCCRMSRTSVKEARTLHNRIIRRRANIELKKERYAELD